MQSYQGISNTFCPILFSDNGISWTESVNKVITTRFYRIASSGPIVFFECDGGLINIYCCLQLTGVITPFFVFVSWLNSFAKKYNSSLLCFTQIRGFSHSRSCKPFYSISYVIETVKVIDQ